MIRYLKKTIRDGSVKTLDTFKTGCWVLVENPSEAEITEVAGKLNLEHGHLTDALDLNEVPRLEEEDGIPYIFTRIPSQLKNTFITIPVLFVIGPNFVLTVSQTDTGLFDKFLHQKISFSTTQKIKLFIQMIKEVNASFNRALNVINKDVYAVTHRTEAIKNRDIINLVIHEQSVNDFLNALMRTNTILNNLLSGKIVRLYEEDRDLIEDLSLASGQLIELAKNTLQTIKNMRDAYSTILTNNLNRVVKLFTSLTVVMTIPTIIASFYGMNVPLPFANSSAAFGLIAFVAVSISTLLIVIFTKNEWM